MMSLLAATLGPSGDVAAGLLGSGGFGVAVPCASAKCSRVFLEVFDGCSSGSRRRAIIREVNETAFALKFLLTGGIGCSESCEKVVYFMLSADLAPLTLHRLRSVILDRPVVTLIQFSRTAALRGFRSRSGASWFRRVC